MARIQLSVALSICAAIALGLCRAASADQSSLGPSFQCPSPRDPLAQLICSSPDLSAADLRYVQAYQALRVLAGDAGQKALRQEAVAFTLRVRSRCNIAPPDSGVYAGSETIPCVLGEYAAERAALASRLSGPAAQEAGRPLHVQLALQNDLKLVGAMPPDAIVDGVYGTATRAAIAQWQQSQGLAPTGLLGDADATRLALQAGGSAPAAAALPGATTGLTATYSAAGPVPTPLTPPTTGSYLPETGSRVGTPYSVPLEIHGGTYAVPVTINRTITLKFVLDSGASDVNIPLDVAMTLMRSGTINDTDMLGSQVYMLADGTKAPSDVVRIRQLRVGDVELQNITASIGEPGGQLLLGRSFLRRFSSWSIDNQRQALLLSQ